MTAILIDRIFVAWSVIGTIRVLLYSQVTPRVGFWACLFICGSWLELLHISTSSVIEKLHSSVVFLFVWTLVRITRVGTCRINLSCHGGVTWIRCCINNEVKRKIVSDVLFKFCSPRETNSVVWSCSSCVSICVTWLLGPGLRGRGPSLKSGTVSFYYFFYCYSAQA